MAEELIPLIVMPTLFYLIGFITKLISDNRVRRELIKSDADTSIIESLFLRERSENPDGSLKWGMVGISLGLALILIEALGLSGEQPMAYGLAFVFGGTGLLGFYWFKKRRGSDTY